MRKIALFTICMISMPAFGHHIHNFCSQTGIEGRYVGGLYSAPLIGNVINCRQRHAKDHHRLTK